MITKEQVYEIIKKNPSNVFDIAHELNNKPTNVRYHLGVLQKAGRIKNSFRANARTKKTNVVFYEATNHKRVSKPNNKPIEVSTTEISPTKEMYECMEVIQEQIKKMQEIYQKEMNSYYKLVQIKSLLEEAK